MPFWFFKKRGEIHKKLTDLERGVSDSFVNLKKDMNKISGWINHFKQKHEDHHMRLNVIEQKLDELFNIIKSDDNEHSHVIERVQSFNHSDASFMNIQSFKNLKNLTPAQKQVLILLAYAGGPLDYESISSKLGLNIVTIRRHINDLKRGGAPIMEKVSVKNRRKVFLLNSETKKELIGEKNKIKSRVKGRK